MSANPRDVPASVQHVLNTLHSSLPEFIKNQNSSAFCNDVQRLYEECVGAADASAFLPDAKFRDDELEYLQDLLVTVLHQAALSRNLVSHERTSSIVSEVVNMLLVIFRRAFSGYELRTSAAFAVAKQPHAGRRPPVPRLYRTAEIIVRPVTNEAVSGSGSRSSSSLESTVESNAAEEARIDETDTESDPDDASDCSADVEDDVSDEESPYSSDSAPDAVRFLRGVIGTPQQLLYADDLEPQQPVVACVAHVDTIAHLMTSALLHRLAVGVERPLFGISFDKYRPAVQIHVAWLEEEIEEGNDLPLVCSLPEGCIPPLDLGEPLSALRLALLIRRVADQERIHGLSREGPGRPLPWRADIEEDATPSHVDYSRADCIAMWAAHVGREVSGRPASIVDDTMAPENSAERSTLDQPESTTTNETDDLLQANIRSGGKTTSDETPAPVASGSECGKKTQSHISSSAFVGKKTRLGRMHTQRYFATRGVVFCSAREGGFIPDGRARPVQYTLATAPVWFSTQVQTICKDLCTENDKIYQELLAAHAQQADTFIGPMTPRVEAAVRASLCTVLHTISTLRALDEGADIPLVHNEATYRAHWDQLLDAVVRASGEVDIAYQKEAKLRYPEYNNAGCACESDEYEVMMSELLPFAPRSSQERARFNYWYLGFYDKVDPVEEPLSGTADGIIYLRIADAFGSQGIASEVNIWQPRTQPAMPEVEPPVADNDVDDPEFRRYADNAFKWGSHRKPFTDQERAAYAQRTSVFALQNAAAPLQTGTGAAGSVQDIRTTSRTGVQTDLYIPLLACEFKRMLKGWTTTMATDQCRLHMVAICMFMRMFNLTRFPIFSLVTDGPCGVISCAWNEPVEVGDGKTLEAIFIADQEAVQVDLRNPLDALNVATFIAYVVAEHAPRLRALFRKNADDVDPSFKKYLLKENVSPFQRTRCMSEADSPWKKGESSSTEP
ncbi:hypothetical protein C8Q77DRAFT_1160167 [Trametes polyzona]|nr:hypothetical protein C8Q77DRAFT_1160167 [Trametes polyzona]